MEEGDEKLNLNLNEIYTILLEGVRFPNRGEDRSLSEAADFISTFRSNPSRIH